MRNHDYTAQHEFCRKTSDNGFNNSQICWSWITDPFFCIRSFFWLRCLKVCTQEVPGSKPQPGHEFFALFSRGWRWTQMVGVVFIRFTALTLMDESQVWNVYSRLQEEQRQKIQTSYDLLSVTKVQKFARTARVVVHAREIYWKNLVAYSIFSKNFNAVRCHSRANKNHKVEKHFLQILGLLSVTRSFSNFSKTIRDRLG